MKRRHSEVEAYRTLDGSIIRELMHPDQHGNKLQSLAEATVPVGVSTILHRHRVTEEIYHITSGKGIMTLGDEQFEVQEGDTVLISPGTPHKLHNNGDLPLVLLCCCAPAYSHKDTELL
jgi:mannose-6-phosphate isomerase-like protein (cupin superfamily)